MDRVAPVDERSLGRELALKALYAVDVGRAGDGVLEELANLVELERPPALAADFARLLAEGVSEERERLDDIIQGVAVNWQVARMPYVDRAILRLGTYELLHVFDVPPKVSINEAVQLAKKYSTEKSGAFVNGVLDKIFQTKCPQKV